MINFFFILFFILLDEGENEKELILVFVVGICEK